MRLKIPFIVMGLAIFGFACGGSDTPTDNPDTITGADTSMSGKVVTTAVDPLTGDVGTLFTVTCMVTEDGVVVQSATEFTVEGDGEFAIDGATVAFEDPGEYTIKCSAPALDVADAIGVVVEVTGVRVTEVTTFVDPKEISAGETFTVTCAGKNEEGPVSGFSADVSVTSDDGITVEPGDSANVFVVTATKAGYLDVACQTADGSVKDGSPANVTVKPGAIAKVVTTLELDTIPAGDKAGVTCTATDAYGNSVIDSGMTVVGDPEGLTWDGNAVGGTKAAVYDVTCTPSKAPDAELESAQLTITALEAVGLTLKLIPEKDHYSRLETVEVSYSLVDQYGNAVAGGEIVPPTVDPTEGAEPKTDDFHFQFKAEGVYTFASCIVDSEWCDDVVAYCDGTAPELVIEYPERGATLNGSQLVTVTGYANDALAQVGTLTINGVDVTVGEDGHFEFPMQADHGMNVIDAAVADIFGNEYRSIRSFLFSYEWYPMHEVDPATSMVPYSARIYMDDKLFYNADPTDQNNISALLKDVLKELDIKALLPSPITNFEYLGCKYDVNIPNITYGEPELVIKTIDGGLRADIVITNFKAYLDLQKTDGGIWCVGSETGTFSSDRVPVIVDIFLTVDPVTHRLLISAGEVSIEFENLDIEIDSWFYNLIVGFVEGPLTNVLKSEVEKLLVEQINGLQETLDEFLGEPMELPIDAPIAGMNPATITIHIQPEISDFDAEGGDIEASLTIRSEKLVDRTILGTIGRSSCLSGQPENFSFNMADPAQVNIAAHEDVVNQALYSLWAQKFLHLDMAAETFVELGVDLSSFGINGMQLQSYPLIPPILDTCNPDNMLTLQLGDFYVETEFDLWGTPVDLHMYLFIEMQVEILLGTDPEDPTVSGLLIQVHEPSIFDLEIVHVNEDWEGQEYIFSDLIYSALPLLTDQIKDPFFIAIPAFNLKDLAGGSEEPIEGEMNLTLPDKDLVIDIESLRQEMGYIVGEAGIIIQDPVPEE